MSTTGNSALVTLIVKVVDARLKKILPGLIEKYINESVSIELNESEIIKQVSNSAKKQIIGTQTSKPKQRSSTSFKDLMADDDDDELVVTKTNSPKKIVDAKNEMKLKVEQKTFAKNNPTLNNILKQTAKEIIDDPTIRVESYDKAGSAPSNVIGGNVVANTKNFGNNELKEIMKATGADDKTASLLARDYSGMIPKSNKPQVNNNNVVRRAMQQPIIEEDYENVDYTNPNFGSSRRPEPVQNYNIPEPQDIEPQVPAPMQAPAPNTLSRNPNARVAFQDVIPDETSFLSPEVLNELRSNASYSVK